MCESIYEFVFLFFFQAEDGIRDLVRSRGLGDVYKRQGNQQAAVGCSDFFQVLLQGFQRDGFTDHRRTGDACLLYTSELPTSDLV